MAYLYLGLAFLGAIGPYSFLGQFFLTHGLSYEEFKLQLWASPVSSFVSSEILLASLVCLMFVFTEGRKLKVKGLWLSLLATLLVGVSCGLPLFLYLRCLTKTKE